MKALSEIRERSDHPHLLPELKVEVFVEFGETHSALRRARRHDAFSRTKWRFHMGGIPSALRHHADLPAADLLIIECDEDQEHLLAQLSELAKLCREDTKVVLIGVGDSNELELFRAVRHIGVSDFLPAPIKPAEVVNSILDVFEDISMPKLGRATAFFGASGGCGSSFVARNTAMAMANTMGGDVVLADLDPQFEAQGLFFGAPEDERASTLMLNRKGIDEQLVERLIHHVNPHLSLLSIAPSVRNPAEFPTETINAVIDRASFRKCHVVLDIPRIWSARLIKVLYRLDCTVVTAPNTVAGLRNAQDVISHLQHVRPGARPPQLVVNMMVPRRHGGLTADAFREAVETSAIYELPFVQKVANRASKRDMTVFEFDERSEAAQKFTALAHTVNQSLDFGDQRSTLAKIMAGLRRWW